MCMKFVNTNIDCFKSVEQLDDSSVIISYNNPINRIGFVEESTEKKIVENFFAVLRISIRGTMDEKECLENPLCQKDSLDFILRLTKCDKDEKKRLYVDLTKFTIDLKQEYQNKNIPRACFDFYNYTRITPIKRLELISKENEQEENKYVLKVLVKKTTESDDQYSIQSMFPLYISNLKKVIE